MHGLDYRSLGESMTVPELLISFAGLDDRSFGESMTLPELHVYRSGAAVRS